MLMHFRLLIAALLIGMAFPVVAATGKVAKVLPHYLDLKGRHTLSPSLYDRDAYQAKLRAQPADRSGLRFDIEYRAANASQLVMRVELRAMKAGKPQTKILEAPVKTTGLFTRWAKLGITGEDYRALGEVSAWRVTLWEGETLLGERRSFLWPSPSPSQPTQ